MPNRLIRDWTMSDKVNSLSANAERFFMRLLMKADDFGYFHADVRILKANLFPLLLDSVKESDISKWMSECSQIGLISVYKSGEKTYLEIKNFGQRLRAKNKKFPSPTDDSQMSDISQSDVGSEGRKEVEVEVEVEGRKEGNKKGLILPFQSEGFLSTWQTLIKEKKWKKKSIAALQTSLEQLGKCSEEDAIQMMKNTIVGEWQGLFEVKTQTNGIQKSTKKIPTFDS